MADHVEIYLGRGEHTLYSDEEWYLSKLPNTDEVMLVARYQSDAPDRTGFPNWARTEFCIAKADDKAACQVHYNDAGHLLEAGRISFVPEEIWTRASEECRKLVTKKRD